MTENIKTRIYMGRFNDYGEPLNVVHVEEDGTTCGPVFAPEVIQGMFAVLESGATSAKVRDMLGLEWLTLTPGELAELAADGEVDCWCQIIAPVSAATHTSPTGMRFRPVWKEPRFWAVVAVGALALTVAVGLVAAGVEAL